jgi:chemotaxis protein MotC
MKRIALIAAAAFVLLSGIGGGAYLFFASGVLSKAPALAGKPGHKSVASSDAGSPSADRGRNLRRLLDNLGAIQDKVIYGDRDALSEQGHVVAEISSALRQFTKEDWNDYANVRAAFVYVLSGGDVAVLKPLIKSGVLSQADEQLAQGIMQFAQGRASDARKSLSEVDPRSLDVSLVGPFALARSTFYIDHDNAKAIALLDEARLASPHTAIEEAAARREIAILVSAGDTTRAMMLVADYLRRFGKSVYSWKLFRDFAVAVTKREGLDSSKIVDKLVATTTTADVKARTNLFLSLASEGLLRGRIALAKAAASEVLALKPESPEDLDKALLYQAAAEAPTSHAQDALQMLQHISGDRLSDEDMAIHEVAGEIASAVSGKTPELTRAQTTAAVGTDGGKLTSDPLKSPRVAGAIKSADAALKEADLIISGDEK